MRYSHLHEYFKKAIAIIFWGVKRVSLKIFMPWWKICDIFMNLGAWTWSCAWNTFFWTIVDTYILMDIAWNQQWNNNIFNNEFSTQSNRFYKQKVGTISVAKLNQKVINYVLWFNIKTCDLRIYFIKGMIDNV